MPSICADAQKTLLLVDDEEAFVRTLAMRLEMSSLPCLVAMRGEEALALMDRPELEVVLLDLNMPGLSGLDTLAAIKAVRPDVEVILLTAETDLAVAARAMRRGANDYQLKPVDFPALLASVEKARLRAGEHRERLRALNAGKLMALGSLAEGVGHELNNPLQIIMQRSELLLELAEDAANGQPDFEQITASVESIRKQAKRCGAITAQLLDLAGKTRTGNAKTSLPAMIDKICGRLKERVDNLGLTLSLAIAPNLPLLNASPAEIEPLLTHLLRNAVDAVEAASISAGYVRISADKSGDMLRISVEDSGEGVRPEHLPRIFEPFFSTRQVGQGVGLGLTVCHSIVTDLRGSIRHIPGTPHGSIFVVEIPLT